MSITYVRYYPGCRQDFDYLQDRSVLVFDPTMERFPLQQLTSRCRTSLDITDRNLDLIVFRGRTDRFVRALEKEQSVLEKLFKDTPAIAVVGSGAERGPAIVPLKWGETPSFDLDLEILRQAEIETALRRSNAIFGGDGYHFVLPSGWHSPNFVRLADALQDPVEVSRIVDWIYPFVRENTVLLGDNGSLLSLLLMIRLEVLRSKNWDLPVRTLSEYPVDDESLEIVLDDAMTRVGESGQLLFVVSINSTGRLIKRLSTLTNNRAKIVIICNTDTSFSHNNSQILSTVAVEKWQPSIDGRCTRCGDLHLIGIDGHTYERIPEPKWNRTRIDLHAAELHRDFWEAVDQADAVRLHVNMEYPEADGGGSRHHSIYIDVPKLLGVTSFRNDVLDKLRSSCNPSLVLIPRHGSTEILYSLALEAFPSTGMFVVPHGRFDRLVESALQRLSPESFVLVLDDALVGGRTLTGLRDAIHRVTQDRGVSGVGAFVVLARPPDNQTILSVRRRYFSLNGHQLHWAYKIYLPLGDKSCPWCAERATLSRILPNLADEEAEYARSRVGKLSGELEPPFLLGSEIGRGNEITRRSFFGELRPKAAFAAASCVAQEARSRMNTAIGGPIVDVADVPMAISCYFESVFLAALLRTFSRRELSYAGQDPLVASELSRLSPDRTYPGMIEEFGWAAINHKLPVGAVTSLLRETQQTPTVKMLQRLLQFT